MGSLIVGLIVLALAGCGSTGPDADHVPELGRYDYQVQLGATHYSGDLVIESANATTLTYRFYSFSGNGPLATSAYGTTGWTIYAVVSGASVLNTMTRNGSTYACTATLAGTPRTCSFAFEGPDSVRTSR